MARAESTDEVLGQDEEGGCASQSMAVMTPLQLPRDDDVLFSMRVVILFVGWQQNACHEAKGHAKRGSESTSRAKRPQTTPCLTFAIHCVCCSLWLCVCLCVSVSVDPVPSWTWTPVERSRATSPLQDSTSSSVLLHIGERERMRGALTFGAAFGVSATILFLAVVTSTARPSARPASPRAANPTVCIRQSPLVTDTPPLPGASLNLTFLPFSTWIRVFPGVFLRSSLLRMIASFAMARPSKSWLAVCTTSASALSCGKTESSAFKPWVSMPFNFVRSCSIFMSE